MKPAFPRAALLAWYRRRRRDLPWRENRDPYRVWVSEIMLQQTTVAAVLPRYEAFLRLFPTIAALARAPESAVLAAWAGLGYYSRARNLREAARRVVAERGGRFPSDYDGILALPGIGRYTAGAIGSIAFGRPWPLVDGNVIRVFARWFGLPGNAKEPALAKECWARAERLVPAKDPGDWNQALMELGATVCLPEDPSCGACPIASTCAARRTGRQAELPAPAARRAPVPVKWTFLWIERDGKVLLWKRGPEERLLKNLWGLPEAGRVPAQAGRALARASHTITHHALSVTLRSAVLASGRPLPPEAAWTPRARLKERLVSSLWTKLLARPGYL